jgi:DNA-binding LacI/PurR family transcriptional regulator
LDQPTDGTRKKRKAITARELAKMIGVSQSAVSRAFSPGASISPELRERILTVARQVDYQPNAIASMLSKRRTNIVGILVSDMQNPFYPTLIEKLSRELQKIGLQSLLFNITRGTNIEEQLVALRQYNVDAVVIVSATLLSGPSLAWAADGRAAVLVNRALPDGKITSVSCNNRDGARAIADHFNDIGRRRVAYVSGLPHTSTNRDRHTGFVTRVAELGMTLIGQATRGEYTYEAGYQCALELAQLKDVEAIFFANDILAIGGIDALRDQLGLRVPEDVAVAGFDDIGMSRWPRYNLTTFSQPVDAMVARTVDLLKVAVTGVKIPEESFVLPGQLLIRGSSVPMPAPQMDALPSVSVITGQFTTQ